MTDSGLITVPTLHQLQLDGDALHQILQLIVCMVEVDGVVFAV